METPEEFAELVAAPVSLIERRDNAVRLALLDELIAHFQPPMPIPIARAYIRELRAKYTEPTKPGQFLSRDDPDAKPVFDRLDEQPLPMSSPGDDNPDSES